MERVRSPDKMRAVISKIAVKECKNLGVITVLMITCTALALPTAAQQQGPLPPPPPSTVAPSGPSVEPAKKNASAQETPSHITNEPPGVPVHEIIQQFTQHQDKFPKNPDHS